LIEGPPQGALHEVARVGPLSIMPSGVIPPDPAELLASKRTVALFEMLVGGFDVIVVDSPPLLEVTDALVLSRLADAVVLVTSARRGTPKSDLHRSIELLSQVGAPVIGALLNDVDSEVTSGYGYGYGADGYSSGGSTEGHRSRRKTTPGGG
jgi:capsular exopolysaccharide synthesis family protein